MIGMVYSALSCMPQNTGAGSGLSRATRQLLLSNSRSCIDKLARVLIGMFTPRRYSIDSLLRGEKDQSSKVPNWTEKSAREVIAPVEAARVLFTECVGRDFGRERKDRPRVYRMFVIRIKCFVIKSIQLEDVFRLIFACCYVWAANDPQQPECGWQERSEIRRPLQLWRFAPPAALGRTE
jgi:hypothetical protein